MLDRLARNYSGMILGILISDAILELSMVIYKQQLLTMRILSSSLGVNLDTSIRLKLRELREHPF